jgi:exportin-2 (importin alpha re-exporter)
MLALLKLFLLPLPLTKNTSANGADDEVEVADLEETGYQASFSKLGASERARPDPVAHVAEPRTYLATSLVAASQARPGQVNSSGCFDAAGPVADLALALEQIRPLVEAVGAEFATPFLSYLSANGFELH